MGELIKLDDWNDGSKETLNNISLHYNKKKSRIIMNNF